MQLLRDFVYYIRHLDEFLEMLSNKAGIWSYVILGVIVFCETGLVVTPFLPGDSLLFAIGAFSMRDNSNINPVFLGALLIACAIAGDTVNYHIGKAVGPRVMRSDTSRWLNKKHLEKTAKFYEKYGGKTIILARFVPIVRTFAPFVAGAGAMNYRRFIVYNITGAIAWVVLMMGCGVVFGQTAFVKKHFEAVVIAIVIISIMPMVIEAWRARRESRAARNAEPAPAAEISKPTSE